MPLRKRAVARVVTTFAVVLSLALPAGASSSASGEWWHAGCGYTGGHTVNGGRIISTTEELLGSCVWVQASARFTIGGKTMTVSSQKAGSVAIVVADDIESHNWSRHRGRGSTTDGWNYLG